PLRGGVREQVVAPDGATSSPPTEAGSPAAASVLGFAAHAPMYAHRVSRQEETGPADDFAPILRRPGACAYERYLRTAELLARQKAPDERGPHAELLYQVTHQSSELWL